MSEPEPFVGRSTNITPPSGTFTEQPPIGRDSGLSWTDTRDAPSSIDSSILSVKVSYKMDLCAQIAVQVHDPDFTLAKQNFFYVTREVWYRSKAVVSFSDMLFGGQTSYFTQLFEIGRASLGPSQGSGAIWTLELRTKAIQQMKRARGGPEGQRYGSGGMASDIAGDGHAYAVNVANKFGLSPFYEETDKSHGQIQAFEPGEEGKEGSSVWEVLSSLAGTAEFVCFEVDGMLIFGSHDWLIGRWGTQRRRVNWLDPTTNQKKTKPMSFIPARWPRDPSAVIQVIAMPQVAKSDNDPFEVTGSMLVDRTNGTSLRPGMTIQLQGIPMFGPALGVNSWETVDDGLYLITGVDYDHLGTTAVAVQFRSPVRRRNYVRHHTLGRMKVEPMRSANAMSGRQAL